MKLKIVESVPRRTNGRYSKYLTLMEEFAAENDAGTCAILEEVATNRAPYLKSLRCSNELPIKIVTREGSVYLERVESFNEVK